MTTLHLKNILRQLNRVDLEKDNYSYLVTTLRAAAKGTRIPMMTKTEICFRVRVIDAPLNHVSELGPPPAARVTGFQRCNPPGVPFFYAASRRLTALLECDIQPGQIVYLSQWITKKEIPLNNVLTTEEGYESELSPNEFVFHNYLDTIFTRPVPRTFSAAYKLTAAATEFLTTNFQNWEDRGVGADGLVALTYSSVAHIDSDGYNLAMRADFAADNMQIIHVTKLRVLERKGREVRIEILDTANDFQDGVIVWLGNAYSIPVPRDADGTLFISNGREWLLQVRDTPLGEADLMQFLAG